MNDNIPLDIIVPVFNEKDVIVSTLEEIKEKIATTHRIHIVYDFDEDNTLPVVKAYVESQKRDNIVLLKNDYGRGVINALKKGFQASEAVATLVVMGDLSDDLGVVDAMFGKIQEGFDIVCGSRYMKGGRQIGGPFFKGLLSRMAGLSLHWITSIPTHDISNSFKMYRTSLLKSLKIESTGGFEIGLEVLVKAFVKGYKITEIPSVWKDRVAGKSNFKLFKWLPKYLKWYVYAIKNKP
jgi:glycosyltransferase involved in cell wall biosynthesis